jgi:hypothetical protein
VNTELVGKDTIYTEVPEQTKLRCNPVHLLVPLCTLLVPIRDVRKERAEDPVDPRSELWVSDISST